MSCSSLLWKGNESLDSIKWWEFTDRYNHYHVLNKEICSVTQLCSVGMEITKINTVKRIVC
jgi:hypothetical protein